MIKHLLDRGESCPKVLVATHFHDVFKTDMLDPETLPFTPVHMQIMFTTTGVDGDDGPVHSVGEASSRPCSSIPNPEDKITYLYRFALFLLVPCFFLFLLLLAV